MLNSVCQTCGGCELRSMEENAYRTLKLDNLKKIIASVGNPTPQFDEPIFIKDGCRRRADMEFSCIKKKLVMGFYEVKTHHLLDISFCPMLCAELNAFLPALRRFLENFCQITLTVREKKKLKTFSFQKGSIRLLKADNGISILLNLEAEPGLEHRLAAADFVNAVPELLRLSWSIANAPAETVALKSQPMLYLAGCAIELPDGVFLQASKEAETAMVKKLLSYLGTTEGKIADLFCGLGTFTFPLAQNKKNEIIASDSSSVALKGMQKALNLNQIHNVTIKERNLFKYPFDTAELKGLNAVVIDPPRAGAHEQCRKIASLKTQDFIPKVIYVSCNPNTFAYDAKILVTAGYNLEKITLVDQFVYSKHQELIALFTYNPENKKEHNK